MRSTFMKRLLALTLSAACLMPLTACESKDGYGIFGRPGWHETETGAAIGGAAGAATGAAIGSQSDDAGKGALLGGATGATIGGVIGREIEEGKNRDRYR